jgi:hypothetical protein
MSALHQRNRVKLQECLIQGSVLNEALDKLLDRLQGKKKN